MFIRSASGCESNPKLRRPSERPLHVVKNIVGQPTVVRLLHAVGSDPFDENTQPCEQRGGVGLGERGAIQQPGFPDMRPQRKTTNRWEYPKKLYEQAVRGYAVPQIEDE